MNCTRCQQSLSAWHTGQLEPHERDEVQLHLAHCEACVAVAAKLERLFTELDRQEQPSPLLLQRFEERMARETAHGFLFASRWSSLLMLFQKLWPKRPLWALSYSFSLLCIGLLGGQLLPPGSLGLHVMNDESALPGAPLSEGSAPICPVQYSPFDRRASVLVTNA